MSIDQNEANNRAGPAFLPPAFAEAFNAATDAAVRPDAFDGGCAQDCNVRPVTPGEQAQIDGVLDDFGFMHPKPPEGKGAPAAPSPDLPDLDGEPVVVGSIVVPALAGVGDLADARIVTLIESELVTVEHVGTGSTMVMSRRGLTSFWRLARTGPRYTPADPVDIATAIYLHLDQTKVDRVKVRELVTRLLRCCAA